MTTRRVALASLIFLILLASFCVLPGQPAPSASARQQQRRATPEPPQSASIEISTMPGGFPLFIDDVPAGETTEYPRLIELEAGTHKIEVEFPGHERWVQTLSIRGGQRTCLTLNYRPKSPGEAPPGRIQLPPSTRIHELRQGYVTATILDCGVILNSPEDAEAPIIRERPRPTPQPTPQPTPLARDEWPTPEPTPQATPSMNANANAPVLRGGARARRGRRSPASIEPTPSEPVRRSPPSPRAGGAPGQPEPQGPSIAQPTPQSAPSAQPEKTPYKLVPIFYGTDRARTGNEEPQYFYGAESSDKLELGKCEVTIPESHVRGNLESPSIWRGEFREDPEKHIVMLKPVPLEPDEFNKQFQERLGEVESRHVFVFIHGYNVKFVDAARRTAQLANDLKFPGVPVLYSWPSQGTLRGYFDDGKAVEATEPHLKQFLSDLLAQANGARIHLVAHSMGNRALTGVLQAFAAENAGTIFGEVILTAPDIDVDKLRTLAPDLRKVAQHITLYASSGDGAMVASQKVNGSRRAGDSMPEIVVLPGIDSIDATGINTDMLGHSYFAEMKPVMDDIVLLLNEGKLPADRSLLVQTRGAGTYWRLPAALARPDVRPGLWRFEKYLNVRNLVIFVVLFVAFVAVSVWLVLRARRRRRAQASAVAA